MAQSDDHILESAIRVIQRHGTARSTMSDYAAAAGVSRQTLYAKYPNREALLVATVRYMGEKFHSGLRSAAAQAQNPEQLIDAIFEHLAMRPRMMLDKMPDSAELMFGANDATRAELDACHQSCRRLLGTLLEPYSDRIEAQRMSVATLADFLDNTLKSIKKDARDRDHMMTLLGVLRQFLHRTLTAPA